MFFFKDTGQPRPVCINHGCDKPVAFNHRSATGHRTLRSVCSTCHVTGYGKANKNGEIGKYPTGVISFKKTYCENNDGRLGYMCTATIMGTHQLELDHIDGNHINNFPHNVQTLCKNCHSHKSGLFGDHKKNKETNQLGYRNTVDA